MANFHLEVEPISRKRGRSPVRAANYQSGERLRDDYYGRIYYNRSRSDIVHTEIILPLDAPQELYDRQTLWSEVDKAEKRSDSRTARRIIASLPNEKEYTLTDHVEIVRDFVADSFISMGMCADIAIHYVEHNKDPAKNNPHVHILLPDRPVGPEGFFPKKNRDWINKRYIRLWRENWADVQNRSYERKGLGMRVTHKSYIERGLFDREPKRYLSRKDIYLERNGIRTIRGDENRAVEVREQERREQERRRRERSHSRGR